VAVSVVEVDHLVKTFTIRKQKSLKENLVNASRGRAFTERFRALDDVCLTINAGDSIGLVGPNGSGKSTLLKLIGGILTPTSGQVRVRGRIAALLELGAGFHPDLSGRDNIYLNASVLGLSRAETAQYFDDIVDFSGISEFIDTQVKFYSSGMYVRLAFAVAVHVDPDILLVDEVLAVGDAPFQAKCMAKIHQFQREGRTIVLVSHSSGQVADVCNRAIVLENGQLVEDGDTIVALGRLRREYQGQIEATRKASQTAVSPYQAHIKRVYLTSEQDYYHHSDFQVVTPPGFTLLVHCEVEFETPTPNWAVEVAIETTLGEGRLTTDSRTNLKASLPPGDGLSQFILRLPDLQLGEGDYVVNVALRDEENIRLDTLPRAGLFAVRGDQATSGPVYSKATIELAP
jgi:ABC-2 type transport system ATP-binding protein